MSSFSKGQRGMTLINNSKADCDCLPYLFYQNIYRRVLAYHKHAIISIIHLFKCDTEYSQWRNRHHLTLRPEFYLKCIGSKFSKWRMLWCSSQVPLQGWGILSLNSQITTASSYRNCPWPTETVWPKIMFLPGAHLYLMTGQCKAKKPEPFA